MKAERRNPNSATKPSKETKLSRTHAPADLSPVDWQRGLRRQFGREQAFGLENLTSEPFFSEFRVSNPVSKSSYRVAIRGLGPGGNFCSCPDYATSELGTCKHIEFTLARLEKKRGARAAFKRGYLPAFSELYLRNEGRRRVHFRAGTDCPPELREAAAALFDAERDGMLPDERLGELEPFMAAAAKCGHELRAYDDALDFVAGRRDADRRASKLEQLFPRGAADPKLLALLKAPLYPYQAEGALFAVRVGRALIGDDMGLGKTIQAIAATEILARHFGVAKVLVICPTSLKYQWQSEIVRFSGRQGESAARVIAGGRAQRQKDYALDDFCKITNYEKLKPDLDLIAAWAPELVIVDEAQRVKNWNTIAARALKRIDSPYAIVLTGTPLENKLEELISIVQFVDQHRLGPTWKLLHEHQVKDEAGRVTGYTGLEKIGQTLAPIMLRRRKSEVLLQLPSRTDQNLLVPMTEMQMLYHQENADVVAQNRPALAQDQVPVGSGSAAADLRPAEHAHVVQQHLSARPGDRPWRQGRRIGGAVRRFVRRARRPRRWCFRNGRGPTTSSSAASKRVSSATSASTAACRRTSDRRWSSGFVTTPPAACSCPPTRAARASICSMLRPW